MELTQADYIKLRAWGRSVTDDPDDAIQEAIESLLAKGRELSLPTVWGYMKNIIKREQRRANREMAQEPRIMEFIAEQMHDRLDQGGDVLLIPYARWRGQQALAGRVGFGKGGHLPLWHCQVCGRQYRPKLKHGKRVRSCGRSECAALMRRTPREAAA